METKLKFSQFQTLLAGALKRAGEDSTAPAAGGPDEMPPLILAYIGDAWFSLYIRTELLRYEWRQVRVLHALETKAVCATMQARVLRQLEPMLTAAESAIVRRGRNAKSRVPKSASVQDYHSSTGFESLLGYLFLNQQRQRLDELAAAALSIITREITVNTQAKEK
ncbi:MAG: ribonuclease III domain-containing protein [Sporomusaceae bacterium]|nr:ribonuclease III domain-containing protein [Sporomusaceae bacterium]